MNRDKKKSVTFFVKDIKSGSIKIPKNLQKEIKNSKHKLKVMITEELQELSDKENILVEKIMKVQGLEKEIVLNFLKAEGIFKGKKT